MLNFEQGDDNGMNRSYIERQKLRDMNYKVNEVYRAEARSELLRESVREAIKSLPPIEIYDRPPMYHKSGDRELALCLGDFHYGAEIRVEGLQGETLNEFNSEVFERRMSDLLEQTQEIIRKEDIEVVHVFLVGDLLDGMLRQSQLMRLQYGLVESTVRLCESLALWLAKLGMYSEVHVYACTGNHSEIRPLKAKAREFEDENLEKIILWYLADRFAEHTYMHIHDECKRMVLANVCGYSFLLLHGDGWKNIKQIAQDAVNLYQKPIDFFICGHLHNGQEFPAGYTPDGNAVIVRTPSLCGVDRYAQSLGCAGSAGAVAMVIERGYGRRCVYPITLK